MHAHQTVRLARAHLPAEHTPVFVDSVGRRRTVTALVGVGLAAVLVTGLVIGAVALLDSAQAKTPGWDRVHVGTAAHKE
ncbi:hypothetical protein D5S17_07995 [Pseudonocardiaceae bacterium YIM PH 21723]|nr:hypothetical protein D5S17_07995 [Pseudonocardiaceae bacterium YIM PH 21723]